MNTLSVEQFIELLPLLAPILLLQFGLMIFCVIKIVKQKNFTHLNKPIWLVLVILIQLIGPISYLLVERGDRA